MSNDVHEEIVRRGAVAIQQWRNANRDAVLDLQGADLSGAELSGADLSGADLSGADLSHANLFQSNLSEAYLEGSDFPHANLGGADLTDARSLVFWRLRGACVTGAKLPEGIARFESVKHGVELSKAAKTLFLGMLLASAYVLLTISTTRDVDLLLNESSSTLPVINASVPIVLFYATVPALLCGILLYFCLYLQRLWEVLGDLPAYFPDGTPLDQKTHPWLLSGLVRVHLPMLRRWSWPFSRLQGRLAVLLAYWSVPLTLGFVWLRCLPLHEAWLSGVHLILLVLSVYGARTFAELCKRTLRGDGVLFRYEDNEGEKLRSNSASRSSAAINRTS